MKCLDHGHNILTWSTIELDPLDEKIMIYLATNCCINMFLSSISIYVYINYMHLYIYILLHTITYSMYNCNYVLFICMNIS